MSPNSQQADKELGVKPSKSDITEKEEVFRYNKETKLVRYVNSIYRKWAYFIADHTKSAITICIILSLLCTIKVVSTPYHTDEAGYVPYGARARKETEIRKEFFDANGKGVLLMAIIEPKDNGTVLREEILDEAIRVNNLIERNFTIRNRITGKDETFDEFCKSFCSLNEPLKQFVNGFGIQLERLTNNQSLNEDLLLQYPKSTFYGKSVNIQVNFNGVILKNNSVTDKKILEESEEISKITNMAFAKLIALEYFAERVGDWKEEDVENYELSIVKHFSKHQSDIVNVYIISYSFVNAELVRAGLTVLPYMTVGFAVMSTCSIISTLASAAYMQQISFHKVYLAIFACICPLMANVTAIGALLIIGVRNSTILSVTPLLVLAIGVDDAYLMIHAWQRTVRNCRRHPTKEDCVAYRLAEVMEETGPAILISALTNILADAVGAFIGSPEITLLCCGNMASILMDFLYQLTFYSAIMCIAGKFEMQTENVKSNTHSIEIDSEKKIITFVCCAQASEEFHDKVKKNCFEVLQNYVNFITNGYVAFFVFCLWLIFIGFAISGIIKITIELTPEKLFTGDSPLIQANRLRVEYLVPQFTMGIFYVNNPGNLSDPKRYNRLNHMVYELEHMNGSLGPDSSQYFLREFAAYQSLEEDTDDNIKQKSFTETIRLDMGVFRMIKETENFKILNGQLSVFDENRFKEFLEWPEFHMWNGCVRFDEAGHLKKFLFTTANHGENLKLWPERGVLLKRWRAIIDKYKDFNVSVYHEDAMFLDLIDNMPTDAWQSGLGIALCMACICFIFLYDTFTVFVASAATISIMTGMMGIASWTGLNLEPIMMAAMLISMGFSVDIPAHVSYHYNSADYHVEHHMTVKEKLHNCLASVGLPAIQASFSTSLCVFGLSFVPVYMAQVFVRMMISCIMLCLVHGVIVIPCILALIEITMNFFRGEKHKISPSSLS